MESDKGATLPPDTTSASHFQDFPIKRRLLQAATKNLTKARIYAACPICKKSRKVTEMDLRLNGGKCEECRKNSDNKGEEKHGTAEIPND